MSASYREAQQLIAFMHAGDWNSALRLANSFRMLGPHRNTIRLAHECRVFPNFYRGLGRDPETAVAPGIAALKQLYPQRNPTMATNPKPTSKRHLTFALAQIEEASGLQAGYRIACGAMRECSEPDARAYQCDDCKLSIGTEKGPPIGVRPCGWTH